MTASRSDNAKGAEVKLKGPGGAPSCLSDATTGAQPVDFPVVGIGASAGGLAAFEAFFSGMPANGDPGMAFVLVQHLDPDHKSILAELIRRYTRMEVFEVEDGMTVKPNCAYIIPPNCYMAFLHGTLQLLKPSAPRGQRLAIDFFFRSLALDLREHAIGIILSGTGSDGALGVRAIKGEGGMVMVQSPDSTEYDGMPRSAIATGLVDYTLPPAEMPARLLTYVTHVGNKTSSVVPGEDNDLKKIFIILRNQTGHDFSHYKPNTINRRIERRMAVHQIDGIGSYVKYLQQTPAEAEALFRDLLIGVTNFFRDPEAFVALETVVIPKLFATKTVGDVIRVWSPGCSSGEEAYSIAILLLERLETLKQDFRIQVFATDIDSQAIITARAGVYPASIVADVSPERLARFFTVDSSGDSYRIHKSIRDLLIFSEQDLVKDPPFSKLDLISCRNLMIYLNSDLQKKIIGLFHYALNPDGMLLLGTSETVGESGDLFSVLDRKAKLYQRKEDFHAIWRTGMSRFIPLVKEATSIPHPDRPASPTKRSLRELTEQAILSQAIPAGALINGRGDILYLHGCMGRYLELAAGESGVNNILKMVREGLRCELTRALHQSSDSKTAVSRTGLRIKTDGNFIAINLQVCPIAADPTAASDTPLFLVVLEETLSGHSGLGTEPGGGTTPGDLSAGDADAQIVALKHELQVQEEFLRQANVELEASNEELKSGNEEMQSVNEELQSTNEELETSKEELQSVNEELATVNAELQTKLADLSRANNDMNNLLAGTGIGTVFVDHRLHILRFTPAVTKIINLIASDVGRPVAHIVSNLKGYDRLTADTQSVLDTLVPVNTEVQTVDGMWYTMRILPYRTLDNVIEGAVITFFDINEMKHAELALSVSENRYRCLFETAKDGILILDAESGAIVNMNPFLLEMLGYTQDQFAGKSIWDIGLFKNIVASREKFSELQQKKYLRYDDLPLETADGRQIEVEFISNVYPIDHRKLIQCDIRDITRRRQIERALARSESLLRNMQQLTRVGGWEWDAAPQTMFWTEEMYRLFDLEPGESGQEPAEGLAAGMTYYHPDDRPIIRSALQRCIEHGTSYDLELRVTTAHGRNLLFRSVAETVRGENGKMVRAIGAIMDITGLRRFGKGERAAHKTPSESAEVRHDRQKQTS